ncbi:MAG: type IV toxin-antitoxin system AbiEi family antitoxin domain-containing protein [Solirubrobacteraceae bacterium]
MAVPEGVLRGISQLARGQNGVVTWEQLLAAGLTPAMIRTLLKRGFLTRLFRGVYAVADPALLPLARDTAALLSLGDAVLSHRSAVALWGMAEADARMVDVTVIGRRPRRRAGVRLHRVDRLDLHDFTTRSNLRVSAPARALIEFATQATRSELESAFGEARAKHLITEETLTATLARAPATHSGAALVRRILATDPGSIYTRSRAEKRLRRLLKQAELPQPLVNHRLCGYPADFFWPDAKLILEVDGYDTHGHRLAFERDRRRDQVHVAAGYTVIRTTWRQLRDEPLAVVARIAQALALRAA